MRRVKYLAKDVIQLIPESTWGVNCRSRMSRTDWQKLSQWVRRNAECEQCGEKAGRFHAHEEWAWSVREGEKGMQSSQELVGIKCLCETCHSLKHLGRTISVGNIWEQINAANKFEQLTGLDAASMAMTYNDMLKDWLIASKIDWVVDISLGHEMLAGIKEKRNAKKAK